MIDHLKEPLTFAVMDIVQNSALFQTREQFMPITEASAMRALPPETVWPVVSAFTSTVGLSADTITKELVVMVYFPFPSNGGKGRTNGFMDDIAVMMESETYVKLLQDMLDWLIGKHKNPSGRKGGQGTSAYNFDLVGDAIIQSIFMNEADTLEEKRKAVHDLVAVSFTATFKGSREAMSQPILTPRVAGTAREEHVNP